MIKVTVFIRVEAVVTKFVPATRFFNETSGNDTRILAAFIASRDLKSGKIISVRDHSIETNT